MSLLAFDPGVGLDKVEIHDEEHGLYMTAGGGTYLLEDRELEVRAGDFIYMAPYCPQSFVAGDAAHPSTCSTRTCGATVSDDDAARPFVQTAEPVDCAGRYPPAQRTKRANPS